MEKIECECGKTFCRNNVYKKHLKTDLHRRRINNIRKCTFCKEEKSYDQFYTHKSGLSYGCKKCVNIIFIEKYENNKIIIDCECGKKIINHCYEKHLKSNNHRRRINNVRNCSYCQEEKSYEEFYKIKDNYSYYCKICVGKIYIAKKKSENTLSL